MTDGFKELVFINSIASCSVPEKGPDASSFNVDIAAAKQPASI